MVENNNPLREKLKCPVCDIIFIPESFHFEKTNFELKPKIVDEMRYKNSSRRIELRPYTSFRGAWVTFCPKCNYLMKFTATIGRRDFSDNINSPRYNFLEYKKPCMDYSDYFSEKVCEIKNQIILKLDEIQIDDWGIPYKDWKEHKTSDCLKFLIKFYTNLENYCESIVGNKDTPMKEKISALPLENEIKDLLENLRVLRNKVAHANYELNQEDETFTDDVYGKLMLELISKQLIPLNLHNIGIEEELNFINTDLILNEIRGFLSLFINMKIGIQNFHDRIYLPLLNILGIERK